MDYDEPDRELLGPESLVFHLSIVARGGTDGYRLCSGPSVRSGSSPNCLCRRNAFASGAFLSFQPEKSNIPCHGTRTHPARAGYLNAGSLSWRIGRFFDLHQAKPIRSPRHPLLGLDSESVGTCLP